MTIFLRRINRFLLMFSTVLIGFLLGFAGLAHAYTATDTGSVIAFSNTPINWNNAIYCIDTRGENLQHIGNQTGRNCGPCWSPDGEKIAFYIHYTDRPAWSIFVMNADGGNVKQLTYTENVWDHNSSCSPDGATIVFGRESATSNAEIWIMDSSGNNLHKLENVIGNGPEWSPRGDQVAYHSSQDGNSEIYTMNIDGNDQRRLTNNSADDCWPS